MRDLNNLLTFEIMDRVSRLHEHRGRQDLLILAHQAELTSLMDIAKIQSTGASNRIEGIFTSDKRLKELVQQKAQPNNRSESEIAGYREVLTTIHENYEYISPTPNIILQLHRDLYSYQGSGGMYKNADNVITEIDASGHEKVRFVPVSAFQTPMMMEVICTDFSKDWNAGVLDKLLLIPVFILDFLCVHPFNDGNGRMSRLLTLLLFYRAGYYVGKYISLEMIIERSKESYYEALQASSANWHDGTNDYAPFVKYYLGVLERAYAEFEARMRLMKKPKAQCVFEIINSRLGKITKREIMELCPHISKITVERALTELVKKGEIQKVDAGSATGYVRKQK